MKAPRLYLLGCIAAAIFSAGCSRKDDSELPNKAADVREIDFWHIQNYEPTRPVVQRSIARCTAERAGLDVRESAFKNDPFKQKMSTAMAARAAPDIFHTWGGGILAEYARYDKVLDLSKYFPAASDRFHPAALDFCTVDGKLYALPVSVAVVPMWYNKALFRDHKLEPPATLQEFYDVCDTFKRAGITPLALGNDQSWPGAFYFMYLATRYGGSTAIAQHAFEDDAFISAGRILQQLVKKKYFNPGFNGVSYDDANQLFFNGDAPMMLMGSWLLAKVKKQKPEFLKDLGCFPFPAGNGDPGWNNIVIGGVNAGYAISAKTAFTDDCVSLLRALTDDEGMADWATTGRIPALTRKTAAPLLGNDSTDAAAILFEADKIQLYYDQLLPPALGAMHKKTCQSLFALTITPKEAAKKMAKTAARLKAQQ